MCFRKHRKDAGPRCENSCENCRCFGVSASQLQLYRYLIPRRIFKQETVIISTNLSGVKKVFSRAYSVWDFAFAKPRKNRGKK